MKRLIYLAMLAVIATMPLAGCAGRTVTCTAPEDTPSHHYLMGMKALEEGNTSAAREKFARALSCDEEFSIAHSGMAIVSAEKTTAQTDGGFRNVEAERVTEALQQARKYADLPDQYFDYYAAIIRSAPLVKSTGWLTEAADAYRSGSSLQVDERNLIYYQGTEALTYFMGLAWLEGMEFQKARDSFGEVLNAKRGGKWHEKADRGWKRVDRIVRAMGGITVGDVGKAIAVKKMVSRADLAALLIDEMQIDKIMAGRIPNSSRGSAEFTPADMSGHPFREEVMTLMKWKVRGMEPKYDESTRAYLFKPGDAVTRGELAFILEDILIKLTGDEKLASAFFGQESSPFPDVKTTSPFYNAVLNMTTRGIMEGELSGEFRINDPVDGAEALLSLRMLKQKTNIY